MKKIALAFLILLALITENAMAWTIYGPSLLSGGRPRCKGYLYEKTLNANTTSTGADVSTTQTDFPIAVHINSSSWSTAGERTHFFDTWNIDGKRVRFYSGDALLPYEVEYYDSASQEAVYWVKKTVTGNNANDNLVYACYGNDYYGTSQEDPTNVWDSYFRGVWHMGDNSINSTTLYDSTSNNLDGTLKAVAEPVDAIGEIRRGRDFDGSDDYISFSDTDLLSFGNSTTDSAFSISAYVKMDDATAFSPFGKTDMGTGYNEYFLGTQLAADKLQLILYDNDSSNYIRKLSDGTITAYEGAFTYIAGTYNGSGSNTGINLYVNGASFASTAGSAGTYVAMHNTNAPPYMGRILSTYYSNGVIDEVRVSATERSAGWVKLEYMSMKKTNYNGDEPLNASCTASTTPYACCTGSGTGTCASFITWDAEVTR